VSKDQFVEWAEIELPSTQVSFDVEAFDEAIRSHGVKFIHYMALPCPVGMTDLDDNRRPHPDHQGCTNGFIYSKVGCITGLFTGNSKTKTPDEMGFWDASTVQVSFPRFYDGCDKPLYVAPYDRFYLDECELNVVTWQRFIHSENTIDRLKYPAVEVIRLIDNTGLTYNPGEDFVVEQGSIKWVGSQPVPSMDIGPGLDGSVIDRGAICSARYTYRPYFYVGQMMHELRVARMVESPKGPHMERMPQQVLMHREYVVNTKDQQPPGSVGPGIDADAMRTVTAAMNGGGSFGKR
jgi:hypothetical protein